MKKNNQGFTLVELSIVLVIIGMLIGAVVGGISLVKASKMHAVVADFGKYKEALTKFQQKYYYWPGDQPDATDRWSGVSNGDGDGKVEGCGSGDICGSGEVYQAMKVLSLDNFITGSYTGTGPAVPGSSFPAAPVDGISGLVMSSPIYLILYDDSFIAKNAFYLTDINSNVLAGAISAQEGVALDMKMDDGAPQAGIIRGFDNSKEQCLNSAAYYVDSTDVTGCVMAILLE